MTTGQTRERPLSILVVACFDGGWTWLSSYFEESEYRWTFFTDDLLESGRIAWLRHAFAAARIASRFDLVVSHGPWPTLFLECALRMYRCRTPHIGYTFNHGNGQFFRGPVLHVARALLHSMEFFVTYSTLERRIYSQTYAIPFEKVGFTHWAVRKPTRHTALPAYLSAGEKYVACIGRNNRDFDTLIAAVKGLPIRVILICGDGQVDHLSIPDNVTLRSNVSPTECDQVLDGCLASIVPIRDDSRGVGHMTIVSALLRGIPLVATRCAAIDDYVQDNVTALLVSRGSVTELRDAITHVISDAELRTKMSQEAVAFAEQWLTEDAAVRYLRAVLRSFTNRVSCPTSPAEAS